MMDQLLRWTIFALLFLYAITPVVCIGWIVDHVRAGARLAPGIVCLGAWLVSIPLLMTAVDFNEHHSRAEDAWWVFIMAASFIVLPIAVFVYLYRSSRLAKWP